MHSLSLSLYLVSAHHTRIHTLAYQLPTLSHTQRREDIPTLSALSQTHSLILSPVHYSGRGILWERDYYAYIKLPGVARPHTHI